MKKLRKLSKLRKGRGRRGRSMIAWHFLPWKKEVPPLVLLFLLLLSLSLSLKAGLVLPSSP